MKNTVTTLAFLAASLITTFGQGFGTLRQSGFTLLPGSSESYFESHVEDDSKVLFDIDKGIVKNTKKNTWFAFNGFNFNQGGGTGMEIEIAKGNNTNATIEIRTSGTDTVTPGTLAGSKKILNTGGWNKFQTFYIPFSSDVSGIKNLYFVFKGGNGFLMNVRRYTVIQKDFVIIAKGNAGNFAIDGGAGGKNGQNVKLFTLNGSANQEWVEIQRGNGFVSYLKRNKPEFAIDGGAGGSNGQNVKLWRAKPTNQNQQWKKVFLGEFQYRLQKRNKGTHSIDGGNGGSNNQNIKLWASSNSNNNQRWNVLPQ